MQKLGIVIAALLFGCGQHEVILPPLGAQAGPTPLASSVVTCMSDAACGGSTPLCDTQRMTCVACAGNFDSGFSHSCEKAAPACLPDGSCGCTDDQQCDTGRCLPSGQCAPASAVVKVDNAFGCGDSTAGNGASVPYCQISDALAQHAAVVVIQLAASDTPYASVHIYDGYAADERTDLDLTIIGPGADKASIGSAGSDAFDVSVGAGTTIVSLRGIRLSTPGDTPVVAAVFCESDGGNAALRLQHVVIEDTPGYGILGMCDVTLERSGVYNNAGPGIGLTRSYTLLYDIIANNYDGGNGAGTGGVVLRGASGTMSHLTIINHAPSISSDAPALISESLVSPIPDSGVALSNCVAADDYYGFVDAFGNDFHLDMQTPAAVANNLKFLVDQGAVEPSLIDIDGNGMLGRASDIGADEAQ